MVGVLLERTDKERISMEETFNKFGIGGSQKGFKGKEWDENSGFRKEGPEE